MRLLMLAALVPPLFLLWKIYNMDKIEHEPPKLIAKLFIFGALMCLPAGIIESFGDAIIQNVLQGVVPQSACSCGFDEGNH